ncbi:MAG: hypothetical protein AAF960_09070 [Bacteroidota bacterium]
MKAFIKISLIFLLALMNYQSYAFEVDIEYKIEYRKAFRMQLEELDGQKIYIQIKDMVGTILIEESLERQTFFGRMYNLENLPLGKYVIIVENEQQVFSQNVEIGERFLLLNSEDQKLILKPSIIKRPDYLDVNLLYFEKDDITFTLKNQYNDIVYQDAFRAVGSLNKRLDIQALPSGQYEFEVNTHHYIATKKFRIKPVNTKTDQLVAERRWEK